MNRFSRMRDNLSSIYNNDDEDQLYESQALIDDQELLHQDPSLDQSSPVAMRHRQTNQRASKMISGFQDGQSHLELRTMNNHTRPKDSNHEPSIEFTYYVIQPHDSLQSICLRFACSINQVKRLNGIMNDQEFYALKRIKLPLGKLGLLEEYLKLEQNSAGVNNNDIITWEQNERSTVKDQGQFESNSPGSALFISTARNVSQFKPLLSPGYSSEAVNHPNGISKLDPRDIPGSQSNSLNHSHSFSSLREFAGRDYNIKIDSPENGHMRTQAMIQQSFIKSDLNRDLDLMTNEGDNVDQVFECLDYHVERAKAAAETYDQRAAELVQTIEENEIAVETRFTTISVSKIPELFLCNENFGLSYKKLVVFIIIVCVVIPLLYVNQTTVVTSNKTEHI